MIGLSFDGGGKRMVPELLKRLLEKLVWEKSHRGQLSKLNRILRRLQVER